MHKLTGGPVSIKFYIRITRNCSIFMWLYVLQPHEHNALTLTLGQKSFTIISKVFKLMAQLYAEVNRSSILQAPFNFEFLSTNEKAFGVS